MHTCSQNFYLVNFGKGTADNGLSGKTWLIFFLRQRLDVDVPYRACNDVKLMVFSMFVN